MNRKLLWDFLILIYQAKILHDYSLEFKKRIQAVRRKKIVHFFRPTLLGNMYAIFITYRLEYVKFKLFYN